MINLIVWLLAAFAAFLVFAFLVTWLGAPKRESLVVALRDFGAKRIDFLCRLWAFAGPRFLDKNFLAAALKIAAGGVGVVATDGQVQIIVLALTLVGAFLFTPWEQLPFEKLAPAADVAS
jgi:hypothetical protein